MSGTMNVNYVSSMASRYASMSSKQTENKGFSGTMEKAVNRANAGKTTGMTKTVETSAVAREEMSLEEYKEYIFNQISSFHIDSTRSRDQYSINISDAGFEAMQNDQEYENWVLDYIKRDMAVAAPAWYTAMGGEPAYCILNFGATKEERTGQMFSMGFKNGQGAGIFNSHSDNSFWTNRTDKQQQIMAQTQKRMDTNVQQKKAADKKRQEKELAEEAARKQRQHQQLLQDYWSKKQLDYSQATNSASVTAVSPASAIASKEVFK